MLIVQRAPLGGGGNAACARGGDTSSRACVQPWQRPCTTAGMWGQERTTPHGDRRLPGRRRNPSFSRCLRRSSGVRGPDRLSDVKPQERVQWRTVEQLVVATPGLPTLDAPVPLVVEQLADVLPLVEAKEREEDARMGQVEGHDVLRPVSKRR